MFEHPAHSSAQSVGHDLVCRGVLYAVTESVFRVELQNLFIAVYQFSGAVLEKTALYGPVSLYGAVIVQMVACYIGMDF